MDPLGRRPGAGAARSTLMRTGNLSLTGGASSRSAGLYSFDAKDLDAFALPKLKPAAGAAAAARTGGAASGPLISSTGPRIGGDGGLPATGATSGGDTSRSGAGGVESSRRGGAGLTSMPPLPLPLNETYALVKDALLADADPERAEEADALAAAMLAASTSKARSARAAGAGLGAAAGGGTAAAGGGTFSGGAAATATGGQSLGLTGGDELAEAALLEAPKLKTGEEAMTFFLKYGPTCPVKFVYLVRRHGLRDDLFRPYDLTVVPQSEIGADYFVMSAKGVVHIQPGEPSEFVSLSDWMRDSSGFNVCTSLRFFKLYLPRKIFTTWRANVRFNRYCRQRAAVRADLFTWKPAFAGALVEVFGLLAYMERTPLLHTSSVRYTIGSFLEAQASARSEGVKVIEKQIAQIQAVLERVAADVVKRARAHDEDDDGADGGGGAAAKDATGSATAGAAAASKTKSMAAARVEAARRAAELRAAVEEEAELGTFVRLVDYMVVETIARAVRTQVAGLLHDIQNPDARKTVAGAAAGEGRGAGAGGMFVTAVRFDHVSGTIFEPPLRDFCSMMDNVLLETVRTCTSTPRILYARQFREYVQDLPTEGGPGNLGAPTVAGLLSTSPEFARCKAALEDKFGSDFAAAAQYVTIFDAVRPIYEYGLAGGADAATYRSRAHSMLSLQRDWSQMKAWDLAIAAMRMQDARGCLAIDSKRLKNELEPITAAGIELVKAALAELTREKVRSTCDAFRQRTRQLVDARPTSLDKFAAHLERVQAIKEAEATMRQEAAAVDDMYRLLQAYDVKISSDEKVAQDDLRTAAVDFDTALRTSDAFLETKMSDMTRQLDVTVLKIAETCKVLTEQLNEGAFIDPHCGTSQFPTVAAVLEGLEAVRARMNQLDEQARRCYKWQGLFGVTPIEIKPLAAVRKALDMKVLLWSTLNDFETRFATWTRSPLVTVDVEEVAKELTQFQKTAFSLDKSIGDAVSAHLKTKVAEFKVHLPVLMDLGNKAMRERHWKRLYEDCGQPYFGPGVDSPPLSGGGGGFGSSGGATADSPGVSSSRTLSDLMAFGIFEYGDIVGEISGTASGEAQLEASLHKIVTAWAHTVFVVKPYREQKGVYIVGGLEDVMTQMEDHQVLLQTMLGSRYIAGVRAGVEEWDKRLAVLSETLDEWVMVQKQWMYLETIFSAEDIQRQLPAESTKFHAVDKRWKDVMSRTHSRPLVVACLDPLPGGAGSARSMPGSAAAFVGTSGGNGASDDLLKLFQQCNEVLEAIQKSLEDYLETKRSAFPRFYFLSNDELLAILSQSRDPTAVQPHLSKCFDSIKSLDFVPGAPKHTAGAAGGDLLDSDDPAAQRVPLLMQAMNSSDGEKVPWPSAVAADGNVEDWLGDVEGMMRSSLLTHTKHALSAYPSTPEAAIDRRSWLFGRPAQCVIVIDQVMWTAGCTEAISRVASGEDRDALAHFLEYNKRQISAMVALVRGDLTRAQRTLLGAIVVIDVHARDVVATMTRKGVSSLEDFEWTKQLRYYWDTDIDNCVVRQTNTRFVYGYEYLGNSERLVITPLTDQCYMTLTGALHLKFGGAPAGPAGTGKTETTKDLAKALAMQCIVFNCSDGLDYKMMGRFFSGLAQAGAWSCFDEFNRIDIEVLSVIAQQILVIQQGLIARAPVITFEGREIPLNPAFGVFITMNPGYAGRTELPDNLKALFRPVAMMVPDYRLIAEIILFSQGFTEALVLSSKMVQLYKLASEQLSKQDHYDFGMRAVKSVLVAAGQLKRKEPNVNENVLLIRAMRDSNVPKFLEHDLPLFKGILSDLFPGVDVPFVDYGKLQTAIEDQLEVAGLQKVPSLITKIIQTHETQLVRHGMMLVGEAGSGKSTNHEVLARALTQLSRDGIVDKDGFYKHVQRFILNPKSVTMGELYGEFNLTTQEWRPGLVAQIVHDALEDKSGSRLWVIFDGPVDALWIENMNTVLDDNKMLCLANGERIKLPPTMHMMFEVRDLAVASPATVSRCGMVFHEPLHVGVLPLVHTWAAGEIEDFHPDHVQRLVTLLEDHVPKVIAFLRSHCTEVIASRDANLVQSFLTLLLSLVKPNAGVKGPYTAGAIPRSAAVKARERWEKTRGVKAEQSDAAAEEDAEEDGAKPVAATGGASTSSSTPAPAAAAVAATPMGDDDDDDAAASSGVGHTMSRRARGGGMDPDHLKRVIDLSYVFAFMWSFGCNIHDKSRAAFNAFALELLADLLPDDFKAAIGVTPSADGAAATASSDLTDYFVDVESGSLKDWRTRIQPFAYLPSMPYFNILVPTRDTTRYSHVFRTLVENGRNVMFSGETGVGKSVVIVDTLNRMSAGDAATFVSTTINFSAQTHSANLQEALEANLDRKRKNLLGAPAGKTMVVFVDDLNMPQKETYGAQPPIELLRQVIDQGGFYDRQKLFFKNVANVVFAAACAPPGGGRNDVTPRLTRHYHMMWVPALSAESMTTIFDAILGGFLASEKASLASLSHGIVSASVDLYRRVESELLPTPAKSHYTFNLRDLSKVFQGMLMVTAAQLPDKESLLRLWVHEVQRVFRDRLINQDDRDWFNKATGDLLATKLGASGSFGAFENMLFGDYLVKGSADKQYQLVTNPGALDGLLTEYLDEYNVSFPTTMNLVFFKDAIAHVSRLCRILRQPRGNALLVGVGGSGRHSLTRLAAFMADYQCSSIEITRGYGANEWHDDIKKLLMAAGIKNKDIVFVFGDTQIVKESFLEDINNILNSGDVPNLYAPDEMEQIISGCRAAAKAAGRPETRTNIFAQYIQQVREHFHVVLCMSPIGAAFRNRCRQFPSLVNCCTIDWFNAWPDDALFSVARSFLSDASLSLGPLVDPLCHTCVRIHQSVEQASQRYLLQQRRHNYTTPTSYLELLRLYVQMLQSQRDIVNRKVLRYQGGLQKLATTNKMVAELQVQLTELQPVLAKASEDTAALLVQVANDQKEADTAAALAAKDEAECAEVAKSVSIIKDDCQKDLDEALPAYYGAVKALKSLDKNKINEVKSFTSPPRLVGFVLEAVCILLGVNNPTWADAKQQMNQMNFLERLAGYDKDHIPPKVIAKVMRYYNDKEFTPETMASVSLAANSLCLWVRAIVRYHEVATTIAPKKAALAEAEAKLASAQALLEEKRAALAAIQARLAELKATYETSLAKQQELDKQSKITSLRLERAHKLTDGLGDEAVRWSAASKQLEADLKNLVGNMLVASGCIAYVGPFTAQFRRDLVADWITAASGKGIPVDPAFSLVRLLADPVVVREWNIMGLPADDFNTENGLFASLGRRWPLMIDPQSQANRWIKNVNKDSHLTIIKLSQPDFLRTLENAIRFGRPVLLENVEEELDPALEPVLLKQTFKKGGQVMLRLGDTDVPYSDDFRFYITTKLANPHYMPEVCIKVTVINFTVTLKGLEDQLLVDVVRQERPDLERKKDQLIVSIAADKKQLKEIEDKILQMLADSKGDLLDDTVLISTLADSKTMSKAINERMVEAENTTKEISDAREQYRPVATRGSILYFVIADLANVDSMYQYSLQAFTRLYNMRIERSERSSLLSRRVSILIDDLTRAFYINVCRGLFAVHKLLYAFLIAVQIMRNGGAISDKEWALFLVGASSKGAVPELPAACAGWLSAKAWAAVHALDALPAFRGLAADLSASADEWQRVVTSKTPASEPLPGKWNAVTGGAGTTDATGMTTFQRLLIVRALREEKTVQGVREFVRLQLGAEFCEAPPFDLEGAYADSTAQTPIIFVLSPGADPVDSLLKLAASKGKGGAGLRIISLGQGQGPIAERMMEAARKTGDWCCLMNCHLAVSWLPKLEALLEATAGTGEHPEYRLWLTSMPSPKFPVPVLQNGIKLTNEPPRGIKANLMRTFLDLSDKEYEGSTKPDVFKKLLFGLAFYHAIVLERRKYGAIGWNISYDFANSDLKAGVMHLRMYLDEQPGVPFETLNNVIGDITYGGRVTDKWDKRTNVCLLGRFYNVGILDDAYKFSESGLYFAPPAGTLADLRAYIETLPLEDAPEVFGLHENASITLQLKETGELIDTVVTMQPREGGGGGGGGSGGQSAEAGVLDRADDILRRLPTALKKSTAHPSTFATIDDGSVNSLGVFLEQEMVRFNKLLKTMAASLEQLKKAVKGLVVMSSALETMFNAFLYNRVPPEWENAAYPSLKPLASWVDDLLARLTALQSWLVNGPPPAFWISGFFFPQGFMTGALQTYARQTRLAIDTLDFRTDVMPFAAEDVTTPPPNGVYIYGLFLEGARWDGAIGRVAEMRPGVLYDKMPCLWLEPVVAKDLDLTGRYPCPFYKTSKRAGTLTTTGHSSNFVMTIYLPSTHQEQHWVARGVALLSMLDD